jgi:Fibronectin type III domain
MMPRSIRILCLFAVALVLAARANAATLTLAWDANLEPNVIGYFVVYGTASGTYTTRLDAGNHTQFQIPALTDGQTYYFAVQAYNSDGELSDASTEINARVGPPVSSPAMSVDTPVNGATVRGDFVLGGWAIDRGAPFGTGVDALHVWAYPAAGGTAVWIGTMPYGGLRNDVGGAFGSQFASSGFTALVRLNPGAWDLVVYSHSTVTNAFSDARVVRVTALAPASNPVIFIDTPRAGFVNKPFAIAGWAADFAVPAGGAGPGIDAIHVYAYPNPGSGAAPLWLGVATLRGPRSDVAGIFGSQFLESGYGLVVDGLAPGLYRIVTYAHSTISGTFSAVASVDVTVR